MITGAPKANEAEVVHGGPLSSMSYVGGIIDVLEPDPSPYCGDESPSINDEKSFCKKHGDVKTIITEVESTTGILHNKHVL